MFIGSPKKKNTRNQMLLPLVLYREESESDEELEWRLLRAGDLDRGLAPPLLAGLPLLLLLLLLGGDLLLADLGINTGAAEISCPSICPPSMCFIALSASACVLYSM